MYQSFDFGSFMLRLLFAVLLVAGTWNPTGYSYANWIANNGFNLQPLILMAGILLLIGWIIYLRATFLSMGWLGVILGTALFGSIIWLFVDLGWLTLEASGTISWLGLVLLSILLAVGISWSHIRRRLTGQLDVDHVEE
ncbi:hypothetical protein CWI75_12955 [Kineobactrum sediminis]|uniref:Uncharacterized protein n=1 Tax=Kineobactrum sediminis TaxID=1905677 RepID=A0A2N5Y0T1_9GAMM|nr:DUF6524 family protein [Kineobactrum sediminis]PLW81993.1 hypothetical protein CWI75_12955 [Kineobactrum sediminis]